MAPVSRQAAVTNAHIMARDTSLRLTDAGRFPWQGVLGPPGYKTRLWDRALADPRLQRQRRSCILASSPPNDGVAIQSNT